LAMSKSTNPFCKGKAVPTPDRAGLLPFFFTDRDS
jgi:hypothetical protein